MRFSFLTAAQIAQIDKAIGNTIETFMRSPVIIGAQRGVSSLYGDSHFEYFQVLGLVKEENTKTGGVSNFPFRGVSYIVCYIGIKDLQDAGLYDSVSKEFLFQTEKSKLTFRGVDYKITHLEQSGTLQDETYLCVIRAENISTIGNG
jgi:hypothetical protein